MMINKVFLFLLCVLNSSILVAKISMPALEKIRKKVESAINDDKTQTLQDFLKGQGKDALKGVITFHNEKKNDLQPANPAIVWSAQKGFVNHLVDLFNNNQTEAKCELVAKIQEVYKQQTFDGKPFWQDVSTEFSNLSTLQPKDETEKRASKEQFDTLIALSTMARQLLS